MDSLFPTVDSLPLAIAGKAAVLLLIGLFLLFILLAYVQVKALGRIVHIAAGNESFIVQSVFLVYLLVVVSLFLLGLVIL